MLIAASVLAAMPRVGQAASAKAHGGLLAASLAFVTAPYVLMPMRV
jgi:hypothetical protein